MYFIVQDTPVEAHVIHVNRVNSSTGLPRTAIWSIPHATVWAQDRGVDRLHVEDWRHDLMNWWAVCTHHDRATWMDMAGSTDNMVLGPVGAEYPPQIDAAIGGIQATIPLYPIGTPLQIENRLTALAEHCVGPYLRTEHRRGQTSVCDIHRTWRIAFTSNDLGCRATLAMSRTAVVALLGPITLQWWNSGNLPYPTLVNVIRRLLTAPDINVEAASAANTLVWSAASWLCRTEVAAQRSTETWKHNYVLNTRSPLCTDSK